MAQYSEAPGRKLDGVDFWERDDGLGSEDARPNDVPPPKKPLTEMGSSGSALETQPEEESSCPSVVLPASSNDNSPCSGDSLDCSPRDGEGISELAAEAGAGAVMQTAESPRGLQCTYVDDDDSDSKGLTGSGGEDYSDDTSELSEGERIAFEQRRAEIRRGKAREASPVASWDTGSASASDSWLRDQMADALRSAGRGSVWDEPLLPVTDPTTQDPGAPGIVYIPLRDPERYLQKLPIRFRDLNGRTYLLPWDQVRTWKRARALIRKIHSYNEELFDLINEGEYHLLAKNVWANGHAAETDPGLSSYPHAQTGSSAEAPDPWSSAGRGGGGGGGGRGGFFSVPPQANNPMSGGRARIAQTRDAIILPELWDSVVEPGMYIDMVVWHAGAHPIFGHVATTHYICGRGRGGPLGAGRGYPAPPPPPPPHSQVNMFQNTPQQMSGPSNAQIGMARGAGYFPRPGGWPLPRVAPRRVVTRVKQIR